MNGPTNMARLNPACARETKELNMSLTGNPVEERLKREQEKLAKIDDQRIDRAFMQLLDNPEGQQFVWWLLQIGRVGNQPFTSDPAITAFNCGELNVGNQILARLISVSPQGYVNLQTIRKAEDDRRTEYLARLRDGDDLFTDASEPDDADPDPGD